MCLDVIHFINHFTMNYCYLDIIFKEKEKEEKRERER